MKIKSVATEVMGYICCLTLIPFVAVLALWRTIYLGYIKCRGYGKFELPDGRKERSI